MNGSFTSVIRVTGEEAPRPMFDPALLHRLEEQESKVEWTILVQRSGGEKLENRDLSWDLTNVWIFLQQLNNGAYLSDL